MSCSVFWGKPHLVLDGLDHGGQLLGLVAGLAAPLPHLLEQLRLGLLEPLAQRLQGRLVLGARWVQALLSPRQRLLEARGLLAQLTRQHLHHHPPSSGSVNCLLEETGPQPPDGD
jgi:hypothetical protein